jgi:glycosyltransferase involved in cell wall biosynthesis
MTLHDYNLVCPNYTLKRGLENLCYDHRCYGRKYWHCILNKCVKKSFPASVVGASRLALHRTMGWFENNLKKFIVPSKFLKEAIIADGIPADQIRVLYNTYPFELKKFIRKLPEKGRINEKTIKQRKGNPFVYVGRLSVEKGVLTLVKTFAEIPEQKLWIVGTGPQEFEIQKFIEKRKAKNIKLLGFIKGEELWKIMNKAYIFCIPSECFEVMPISLIEAFALGVPSIGTQVGGIPEVIKPGQTGWLFQTGNIDSLKRAIQESLLITSEKYFQMGFQAQELVKNRHSLNEHIHLLLNVYKEALM